MSKRLLLPSSAAKDIYSIIFGTNGLIQCESEAEFEERATRFLYRYRHILRRRSQQHYDYMVQFLSRILSNVLSPSFVTDTISVSFTTNDAECVNR